MLVISTSVALLAPAVANACTATSVVFGEHSASVRAVVNFTDWTITTNKVEAIDPNPFDGRASVRVARSSITTRISTRSGDGVTVRITQQRSGALSITLTAGRTRFKYLSYAVVGGTRLAIDLWKCAPPSKRAEIGQGGRSESELRQLAGELARGLSGCAWDFRAIAFVGGSDAGGTQPTPSWRAVGSALEASS